MDIIIAILVLGVLIFVHEFGHFLVAKWANVYVEKFSIGFGPVLLSKKLGETEYVLSALPLGGYVKMYGEQAGEDTPGKETYDPDKEGRSFNDKSAWHKAAIVFAGPLFNVIFAIIIFWGLYISGIPSYAAQVGEIEKGSFAEISGLKTGDIITECDGKKIKSWNEFATIIAENPNKTVEVKLNNNKTINLQIGQKEVDNIFGDKEIIGNIGASMQLDSIIGEVITTGSAYEAGFLKNDKILAINGEKINSWSDSAKYIRSSPSKELNILIERDNKQLEIKVTPKPSQQKVDGKMTDVGLIGIAPIDGNIIVHYGPVAALKLGLEKSFELTKMIYIGFAKLVQREIPADSLGGPILIVQSAAQSAESGFATLLIFMAAISINLAVFNLLPIPVLDGGQLAIITAEGIMGRPLGEKAMGAFQMFGLVVVVSLMIFAFYNDIMRLIK